MHTYLLYISLGSYGAIEDVPLAEGRRQFGMARLIQLVTPTMRENHAVEGLSDCLRMELKPFGIDVIVVEPSGIKTDWDIIATENLKKTSANEAYAEMANKAADGMIKNYTRADCKGRTYVRLSQSVIPAPVT